MKTKIGTHLSKILKKVSGHLLGHFDEVLLNKNKNFGQNARIFGIKMGSKYTSYKQSASKHRALYRQSGWHIQKQ